jgi:hypothetical protein
LLPSQQNVHRRVARLFSGCLFFCPHLPKFTKASPPRKLLLTFRAHNVSESESQRREKGKVVKIVVTFKFAKGSDTDVAEKEFHRACLPKAYRLPSLIKVELAKAVAHWKGNAAYERIIELYFDTPSDATKALESKAGKAFVQSFSRLGVADLNLTVCRVE